MYVENILHGAHGHEYVVPAAQTGAETSLGDARQGDSSDRVDAVASGLLSTSVASNTVASRSVLGEHTASSSIAASRLHGIHTASSSAPTTKGIETSVCVIASLTERIERRRTRCIIGILLISGQYLPG